MRPANGTAHQAGVRCRRSPPSATPRGGTEQRVGRQCGSYSDRPLCCDSLNAPPPPPSAPRPAGSGAPLVDVASGRPGRTPIRAGSRAGSSSWGGGEEGGTPHHRPRSQLLVREAPRRSRDRCIAVGLLNAFVCDAARKNQKIEHRAASRPQLRARATPRRYAPLAG